MRTFRLVFLAACTVLVVFTTITISAGNNEPPAVGRTKWLMQTLHDSKSRHVMIFAHRAGWHDAPENSLAGIRNCIRMGIDAVEIDVRKTRDGQLVLMHDKTLDRTTTGTGKVDQASLAELSKLRLRDASGTPTDERIPTLKQAMEAARGNVLVYLDKTEDMIDEVYAHLQAIGATNEAVFFGKLPVAELRKRYGDLIDHITYLPKVSDDTSDLDGYVRGLAAIKPAAFVLEFDKEQDGVTKEIQAMRAAGARIWVSPLWATACADRTDEKALTDPDANWGWLLDQGATVFCTDRPKELLEYLRKRGLRDPASDLAPVGATATAK